MKKERIIYFGDLLQYILRKWKRIIIWMIIFAVTLNIFSVVKGYKEATNQQSNANLETEYIPNLSETEIQKTDENYKIYSSYKKSYNNFLNYYNGSIKMKINPNCVSKERVQYHIKSSVDTDEIITAFSNVLHSEQTGNKIKEAIGSEIEIAYISELIKIEEKEHAVDSLKKTTKVVTEGNDKISGMLISVIAVDEEQCDAIVQVLEQAVLENIDKLQNSIGSFEITFVDKNYSEEADSDLLSEQQECLMELNAIKLAIDNLKNSMTDEQQKYLEELERQESENTTNTNPIQNTTSIQYINWKYILLGLIIGMFLSCVWYLVSYVLNRHLLTVEELEDYCDLRLLGDCSISGNSKKKKCIVDQWLDRAFGKNEDLNEEKIKMICTNIEMIAEKKNLKNIFITSTTMTENIECVKQMIVNCIDNNHFKLLTGKSIITDQESLKELLKADGVVFIEKTKEAILKDIEREVEICNNHDIHVIGAVAID